MNKSEQLKKELLSALNKNLGIVSNACEALGISRTTYYKYYNEDSEFRSEVDNVGESTLDFVESKLFELIKSGNVASTIFFLKTKGKKRGYVEKQEIEDKKQPEAIEIHFVDGNGKRTPIDEKIAS